MSQPVTRAGFAAIIGAPNAGKSTLVNRLVGAKVSIVTQKVQTTRFPVRGVAIDGPAQIVLVDTPGIFTPRRRLDRAMVRSAWSGAEDADVIVHLIDVKAEIALADGQAKAGEKRSADDVRTIIEGLKASNSSAILALNKIDGIRRDRLLAISQSFFETDVYNEVFMISAKTGAGVEDLKHRLAGLMPEGPWLYPEDQTADLPVRLLAAELTREKIYLRLHEELPYQLTVETEKWEERADGSVRIDQIVYVARDGHKGIVLGAGGQTLKSVGQAARADIAEFPGQTVHLFVLVKVRPDWQDEAERYAEMGLEFKDGD